MHSAPSLSKPSRVAVPRAFLGARGESQEPTKGSNYWKLLKSFFVQPALPKEETTTSPIGTPSTEAIGARPAETHDEVRPLGPNIGNTLEGKPVTLGSITELMNSPTYDDLCTYFQNYPRRSLMGDKSRAMLFGLIRMLRPNMVAEIGTYYAGGAEVMARALWENGEGFLLTTDPFGAERCPAIIANWPTELRSLIQFHPLSSMDFFAKLHRERLELDFVLVDGDHDYEAALFDLQMAARLLRPGGIVVMNDSVQTGPFQAARTFLASHPTWQELGTAIDSYDESNPFAGGRASQAGTGFVVLRAPDHWSIGAIPRSWGQTTIGAPFVDGLSLDAPAQVTSGALHYQAILRFFGDGAPQELKRVGSIPVRLDGTARTLAHKLNGALKFDEPRSGSGAYCTFEIELCWRADPGSPPLALAAIPAPLTA
jgi:predicted O-methyltransferase YrrM